MSPTSAPLTVGDLRADLASLAEWLESARAVLGAVDPHDFLIAPPPGWVPGGPSPTPPRAIPLCVVPLLSSQDQVGFKDLSEMVLTLKNWTTSIGESLGRLPQDMEIPPVPGDATE